MRTTPGIPAHSQSPTANESSQSIYFPTGEQAITMVTVKSG